MAFAFDQISNHAATTLRYPHVAGDGHLRVWNASAFPSPTRVVCFSGLTPASEAILSILRVTAVDTAANTLTVSGAIEGTHDVDLPTRTMVEIRSTAGQYQDLVSAIQTLATGQPIPTQLETYTHQQMTPSATWTIAHMLGRYPSVTVVDSGGATCVGEVKYDSDLQVTISFTAGFSGAAYLN